jgi:HK97 family phage major capsid protein
LSLSGVAHIDAGSTFTDIDCFSEAVSALESVGATPGAWCASFSTVLALAKLRTFTGTDITSNEPLLSVDGDVGQGLQRTLLGLPIYSTPAGTIADGLVWLLPRDNRAFVVIREDVEVLVSPYPFFTSDSYAVRTVMRLNFAFTHPAAIAKVIAGGS